MRKFITYIDGIKPLYRLSVFNVNTKVLWKLIEFTEPSTGIVYMNSARADEVMKLCGISKSSYYRALNELKDAGIITVDRGTINVNKDMFYKV